VELVEFGRLSVARRAELEGDESDPFEVSRVTLQFRPKQRHVAFQDEDGRLVASAGMVIAEVEVGGRRFPVVGLGGVIVNARYRGRGLGRRVVEAAVARARAWAWARELEPADPPGRSLAGPPAGQPEFVMLFCLPDRVGLYRRLGFVEVADEVRVGQPVGDAAMPLRTMWRALREGAQWPAGPVDVLGLPF
jgi:GNAT superfamily N-acetyltransferase